MSEEDVVLQAIAPHDGQEHDWVYNGLQDDGMGGGIHLYTSDDGYTHSMNSILDATLGVEED